MIIEVKTEKDGESVIRRLSARSDSDPERVLQAHGYDPEKDSFTIEK